jgi:hypothetical protein
MNMNYQCCFCGKTIEALAPDVAALIYVTCIDQPVERQKDQQLFCHTKCLRERLHPSANLYAADLVEDGSGCFKPSQAKENR